MTEATAVKFVVPQFKVQFGETVKLVGEGAVFGSWAPESALQLEWGEGDSWSADADLPAGPTAFKVRCQLSPRTPNGVNLNSCADHSACFTAGLAIIDRS